MFRLPGGRCGPATPPYRPTSRRRSTRRSGEGGVRVARQTERYAVILPLLRAKTPQQQQPTERLRVTMARTYSEGGPARACANPAERQADLADRAVVDAERLRHRGQGELLQLAIADLEVQRSGRPPDM